MKTINWKIPKGTKVTLRISGSKNSSRTVIDYCPAGISLKSLGHEVSPGIYDISEVNRYVVKIKSGKGFKLRVPVKGKLENSILSE